MFITVTHFTTNKESACRTGFLNLWATEKFLTGHGLLLLKLSTFSEINLENNALVAMKTNSRSRLDVEEDLICA